jgi:hypothetical protein
VVGNYLRKRDNLFAQIESGVNTPDFIRALQGVGAIRADIDAAMIVHILEIISYGQLMIGDFKPPEQSPPYDAVMEALADIMDRALLPEDGGSSEAGKAIFQQLTAAARAQMEQLKQAKDTEQALHKGANNDN